MEFKDKNGRILKYGDVCKFGNGTIVDLLYEYDGESGKALGFNGTNPDWYERNGYGYIDYYPIYDFDLEDIEVIGNIFENKEDARLLSDRCLRMVKIILGEEVL